MRIVSWNVNGIRAVHRKGLFLPALEVLRPDVLCLQETKAMQGQAEIDLPEYEEYWNSASKKGYSGTAVFSKSPPRKILLNIPDEIASAYTLHDSYGDLNAEGRAIAIETEHCFIVNVYTPNAKPDLSRLGARTKHWDPAFLKYVKQLELKKPVIFMGDLNVAHTPNDLTYPKQNEGEHGYTSEERHGIDLMLKNGFVDTFRLFTQGNGHYTWWSNFSRARERNVGWRIDYVFVSASLAERVTQAQIHPALLGSDHCPISIDIAL
jgi:exodeoxyribonuclease-3